MIFRAAKWAVVPLMFLGRLAASTAGETQNVLQPEAQEVPISAPSAPTNLLQALHSAISVMQDRYFSLWLGQWTTGIDWTAAVTSTHLAATLATLSRSTQYSVPETETQTIDSEINKYFGHLIAYYFGQDYFAIRMQAYDDMLWVVLGWLESIQLVKTHSENHSRYFRQDVSESDWHAKQFIPAFAHRARVFYELAEQGWDERLCGGGMTWNPHLLPYKNAITNQLFIAASINMYLHFPGDDNCSPFMGAMDQKPKHHDPTLLEASMYECSDTDLDAEHEYNPVYLENAINGYNWIAHSGMLNAQSLYTDGFHISGYAQNHSRTECDERNEMVYTYNQGVILSGLRGLYQATGNTSYLHDGHTLIRNVVRATGWESPMGSGWAGLGEDGVLTEQCDPGSSCSQDGQTFKGIFWHHFTVFCAPFLASTSSSYSSSPGRMSQHRNAQTQHVTDEIEAFHTKSCAGYRDWVLHNAYAALRTRNDEGLFGAWWGAPYLSSSSSSEEEQQNLLPRGALDYRNDPTLLYTQNFTAAPLYGSHNDVEERDEFEDEDGQLDDEDLNDRGRGRTVETQGGGVAVLRAGWEFWARFGDADEHDV